MLSRAREIAYCYFSSRIQCSQTLDGYLPRLPHNRRYQSYPTAFADMVRPLEHSSKMSLLPTRTSVVVSNQLPRPPYSC